MRIAGIDIGGTLIKAGLFDGERLMDRMVVETGAEDGPERVVERVIEIIKEWDVERAGVGVPGLVDREKGTVRVPPNLPGWEEVQLKKVLADATGIPIWVMNDANVFLLGEWKFGWEGRFKNMVLLTLGTGVGGGILVDGKLLLGSRGGAAEVGHMTINGDGPLCNCGNRGCLEAYIGTRYFVSRAYSLMKKYSRNIEEELTPALLSELRERGEEFAIHAWKEYGYYLGLGIVNLIHLFDPEAIILGGGVSRAFEHFAPSMMETVRNRVMDFKNRNVLIERAKLQDDGGIFGAYYLALKEGNV